MLRIYRIIYVNCRHIRTSPLTDAKPMIYTLQCRQTSYATAATRLRHRMEIEYLFDTGMDESHATHYTRFVGCEKRE